MLTAIFDWADDFVLFVLNMFDPTRGNPVYGKYRE